MFDFMDMAYEESAVEFHAQGPYIPDAGDCLRCGMCVGNCPTFRLFQIDEETPRRRIRTISKILVEKQPVTAEELAHLNNCLQCRACETICPSRMAYGQLFDQAQESVAPGLLGKLAFWLIERKETRSRLMPLIAIYQKLGIQKLLRRSGWLKKLHLAEADAMLNRPALQDLQTIFPVAGQVRGRVALFTGCIAEHFDRATLSAAIKLLNAIGYEVLVPPEQACCGAIHQHNGQSASGLIEKNLAVFNALDVEAVLHAASGCGAMLSEYPVDENGQSYRFKHGLQDINDFLLNHWPHDLHLMPSTRKIGVHEPCSQRNVLKNQQSVYQLLQKIPGLTIGSLADNHICCGAGGSYMLTHPENAEQLRQLKRQAIETAQVDGVVSSNFGCAVFLSVQSAKVLHPLSLLAEQLPG